MQVLPLCHRTARCTHHHQHSGRMQCSVGQWAQLSVMVVVEALAAVTGVKVKSQCTHLLGTTTDKAAQ